MHAHDRADGVSDAAQTALSSAEKRRSPAPRPFIDPVLRVPGVGVRAAAIAALIANVVIVATGGLVRLTGSGLGCDTWPKCTPGAFTTTPEQGIHGLIEFGNRTLSGVMLVIALWGLIAVYSGARHRRDLIALAWTQAAGIIVQAVVGGMVVLFHLTWNLVGFHYILSIVLVAFMTIFAVRAHAPGGPRARAVRLPTLIVTHVMTLVLAVTVIVGVFATGSGPHSGDPSEVVRTGFDAELVYHVHAWSGYVLFALTIVVVVLSLREHAGFRRWAVALICVQIVQIVVGIAQARLHLPGTLVLVHMVLAAVLTAAAVATVLALKRPTAEIDETATGRSAPVTA
ncbi:COX15/CtaA family protein [Pseudoclavibacter sp. 13-3]|uniref:COX15/CtaA family protein n=1 Tax=Pseudoclavibacter sp. 13-3 TaxID=2901228 RepID=UPI001E48B4F1|nr:COX15/CtaA family protein [Pseudoclavibacter sp. 13-3]MCD7101924.1 COX15/CtaA family protein [Pseudoclavibacter sp. 13-3]